MSGRFRSYTPKEDQWTLDGDRGFKGIYMPRVSTGEDRGAVPPGYLARNENRRIVDGASCTRPGKAIPADFNPIFENAIVGSEIYSNPNGDQVMLVATASANYVWALQFGKDPVKILVDVSDPNGTVGTFIVHFIQAYDKVLMMRIPSTGLPPLLWDGDNTHKWMPVTNPPIVPEPPSTIIPTTATGVPFQDRLLLYNPYWGPLPWRNQFIMTDVEVPTQYDAFLSVFRINAGESDLITAIRPFLQQSVVVYMKNSVYMADNFTIDQMQMRQRLVNARIGNVGVYGPLDIGSDQIFLSKSGNGYFRLSQLDQQNPVPISWNIQPVIDRVDWPRAFLYTCSAALGERGYFALPLDHVSGAANAMVVLNIATGEWESAPDSWLDPSFRINRLHVTIYDDTERLFAVDYVAHKIYLMEDGVVDQGINESFPIHDRFASRGYDDNNPGSFKRFQRAIIAIRSYDPAAPVTAVSDGVNERKEIANITKDRTKFYTFGSGAFDPATGDPTAPMREDYADALPNAALEDFEDLAAGTIYYLPPTSEIFQGVMQQSLERPAIRQNGRWCSIEIENTQGRLDVLGAGVDGIPIAQGMTTLA